MRKKNYVKIGKSRVAKHKDLTNGTERNGDGTEMIKNH